LPLRVRGGALAGGEVVLDAAASSQFVSALLMLGCRLPDGLSVKLLAPPPSRPYLDLTVDVLNAFGVDVEVAGGVLCFRVAPQALRAVEHRVEGDWSAAAFPLAGVAVAGGEVAIDNLRENSRQGDAAILPLLLAAGCAVVPGGGSLTVRGPASRPLSADLRDAPDMFPALAVVVAAVGGRLVGLGGLRGKESDRLTVMTRHLRALGAEVAMGEDWFAAPGGLPARSACRQPCDPAADHRIAMALAVAGTVVAGTRIADPAVVAKSWPGFWSQWQALTA
jgi:3-phosphoshikimate 1-carboxyvinyltransferase